MFNHDHTPEENVSKRSVSYSSVRTVLQIAFIYTLVCPRSVKMAVYVETCAWTLGSQLLFLNKCLILLLGQQGWHHIMEVQVQLQGSL